MSYAILGKFIAVQLSILLLFLCGSYQNHLVLSADAETLSSEQESQAKLNLKIALENALSDPFVNPLPDLRLHFEEELPNAQCAKQHHRDTNFALTNDDFFFTVLLTEYGKKDKNCYSGYSGSYVANQVWTNCYGGPPFASSYSVFGTTLEQYSVASPVFRKSGNYYCWVSPEMFHKWHQPAMTMSIHPRDFLGACDFLCPRLEFKTSEDESKFVEATYIGACPVPGDMFRIVIPNYPGTGCIVRIVNNKGDYCHVVDLKQLECFGGDAKTIKFNFLPYFGNLVGDCTC